MDHFPYKIDYIGPKAINRISSEHLGLPILQRHVNIHDELAQIVILYQRLFVNFRTKYAQICLNRSLLLERGGILGLLLRVKDGETRVEVVQVPLKLACQTAEVLRFLANHLLGPSQRLDPRHPELRVLLLEEPLHVGVNSRLELVLVQSQIALRVLKRVLLFELSAHLVVLHEQDLVEFDAVESFGYLFAIEFLKVDEEFVDVDVGHFLPGINGTRELLVDVFGNGLGNVGIFLRLEQWKSIRCFLKQVFRFKDGYVLVCKLLHCANRISITGPVG